MAAGLGFKDFVTGEVLTADDVDGYLMQGTWVFANAAARTAAVTSPQEGNMSYLKDTNATQFYDGAAWQTVGAAGGGMTLINTGGTTLTGATVTIGSIPSTYNNLQLIITNFKPATDNKFLNARFNSDSSGLYVSDGLSDNRGAAATDTAMLLGFRNDNTTAEGLIQADFYNYANTTTWKMGKSVSFTNDATTPTLYNLWAVSQLWRNTAAITSINLSVESGGNFTSGTAYLYGVK
jgi:hypothetical protein